MKARRMQVAPPLHTGRHVARTQKVETLKFRLRIVLPLLVCFRITISCSIRMFRTAKSSGPRRSSDGLYPPPSEHFSVMRVRSKSGTQILYAHHPGFWVRTCLLAPAEATSQRSGHRSLPLASCFVRLIRRCLTLTQQTACVPFLLDRVRPNSFHFFPGHSYDGHSLLDRFVFNSSSTITTPLLAHDLVPDQYRMPRYLTSGENIDVWGRIPIRILCKKTCSTKASE